MNFEAFKNDMETLLTTLPTGLVIEYGISGSQIEFLIREKPVDFSDKQAKELIENLNSVLVKNQQSLFIESDISQLKNSPIGELVASNTAFKFNLKQDNEA
ncbi:hypothetical protein FG297_22875 [Vibrio alginolyticus]|nr:hypothetical protein [Vibrio parahaemolyticus]EHA1078779.1 hypothetical protein [Vibrio alginolyticus]EHA1137219.1 hypothetical protein [Vibrio alginolyticus]MBM5100508.1 hypothetical protein [Vibrio parahaemolyticus]